MRGDITGVISLFPWFIVQISWPGVKNVYLIVQKAAGPISTTLSCFICSSSASCFLISSFIYIFVYDTVGTTIITKTKLHAIFHGLCGLRVGPGCCLKAIRGVCNWLSVCRCPPVPGDHGFMLIYLFIGGGGVFMKMWSGFSSEAVNELWRI